MTAEDFVDWAGRPENEDKHYELEYGEIVETPPPSELHGVVCSLIAHILWTFIFRRGKGYLCSNDSGLLICAAPILFAAPTSCSLTRAGHSMA